MPDGLLLQRIGRLHRHDRRRPAGLEEAECWVLGADGNEMDSGGRAVYGGYLLLRTAELLPSSVTLPDDISPLVQETYMDMTDEAFETDELAHEWESYVDKARKKERAADAFKIPLPQSVDDTIHGWLNDDLATATLSPQPRCATGSLLSTCCSWKKTWRGISLSCRGSTEA